MKISYIKVIAFMLVSAGGLSAQNIYNVLDYGADSSGSTNSSSAFQSAIDAAIGSREFAHVEIPAGTYKINTQVVIEPDHITANNGKEFGIAITGEGTGVSVINVRDGGNVGGFLKFKMNSNASKVSLTVQDLTIKADIVNAGSALQYEAPKVGTEPGRQLLIRNVDILSNGSGKYFYRGINCIGPWYPMFQNVRVFGASNSSNKYSMNAGMYLGDSYAPTIIDCEVKYADHGIWYVKITDGTNVEDGVIRNTNLDTLKKAVILFLEPNTSRWEEVGFHVTRCTIKYLEKGIWLKGLRQAQFDFNNFYCLDTNNASPNPRDIQFEKSTSIIVHNNNFYTTNSDSNRIAVNWANQAFRNFVWKNRFEMKGTAIRMGTDQFLSYSAENTFVGSNVTRYSDPYDRLVTKGE